MQLNTQPQKLRSACLRNSFIKEHSDKITGLNLVTDEPPSISSARHTKTNRWTATNRTYISSTRARR